MFRLALFVVAATILVVSRTAADDPYGLWFEANIDTLFDEANSASTFALDGVLTEDDFVNLGVRQAEKNELDSSDGAEITARFVAIWNLLDDHNGASGDITPVSFPGLFKDLGGGNVDDSIRAFYSLVFALFDTDDSDGISKVEWEDFFYPFGLDTGTGGAVFDFLQPGGEDIDLDTFLANIKGWLTDPDEANSGKSYVVSVIGQL